MDAQPLFFLAVPEAVKQNIHIRWTYENIYRTGPAIAP